MNNSLLHKAMALQVWPAASAWTSLGTWQKGKHWGPAPDLLNQDLCALTRSLSMWPWCTCKLWEPPSRQIGQTSMLSPDEGFSNSALMTFGAGQSFSLRDCPVCYRMLHPLPTRFQEYPPPVMTTKISPDIAKCPSPRKRGGGQKAES